MIRVVKPHWWYDSHMFDLHSLKVHSHNRSPIILSLLSSSSCTQQFTSHRSHYSSPTFYTAVMIITLQFNNLSHCSHDDHTHYSSPTFHTAAIIVTHTAVQWHLTLQSWSSHTHYSSPTFHTAVMFITHTTLQWHLTAVMISYTHYSSSTFHTEVMIIHTHTTVYWHLTLLSRSSVTLQWIHHEEFC